MDRVWEYKVVRVSTQSLLVLLETLNQLGAVGWEAVGFASADKTIGLNEYAAILKRPLIGFPPPEDKKPGWNADPSGRHQLRWWDGLRWESAVNDNGANAHDLPIASPAT